MPLRSGEKHASAAAGSRKCVDIWTSLHTSLSLEPSIAEIQPDTELPQPTHRPESDRNKCTEFGEVCYTALLHSDTLIRAMRIMHGSLAPEVCKGEDTVLISMKFS